MISWKVNYTNFDGQPATEELWFHISQRQLIKWFLAGDDEMLPDNLTKLAESGDVKRIIEMFEKIISMAYGTRPANGDVNRFHKDPRQTEDFLESPAYDAFFRALMTDEKQAAKFFRAMFPPELVAEAQAAMEKGLVPVGATVPGESVSSLKLVEVGDKERFDELKARTGLENPFDNDGKPLPWAIRHPTDAELGSPLMTKARMADALKRKLSGWEPPLT